MVVLVTGGNGQLGQALRQTAQFHTGIEFIFVTSGELDICDAAMVLEKFDRYRPDFCINTAAYTAVDKAEIEPEIAFKVNADGVANLAAACLHSGCTLIQISTDFVFDGSQSSPYTEKDTPNPLNVYGTSKLAGEFNAAKTPKHFIVRTSWVYSDFGNNFYKTMLRLAREKDSLTIVNDQRGTPTFAPDLASALIQIIKSGSDAFGTYHYSNLGEATWFDFAKEIFVKNSIAIDLQPVPTSAFPTAATRPRYSVLDKSKIIETFGLVIRQWQDAIHGIIS